MVWAISMLSATIAGAFFPSGYLESTIIIELALAVPLIIYLTLLPYERRGVIGSIGGREYVSALLIGVGVWAAGSTATVIQDMFLTPPDWYVERYVLSGPVELAYALTLTWIVVAPVEELLFRWVLLRPFLERFGTWRAVLLTSMIFAVSHLDPWNILPPLFVGVAAAWNVVKRRSLIPAIIIHGLHNSLSLTANMLLLGSST